LQGRGLLPAQSLSKNDAGTPSRYQALAICTFLLLAVGLAFGQTVGHDFINLDDNKYVYENPLLAHGLSVQGIVGAFTQSIAANWVPLTWISFMVDRQLYGFHAGGYHLTNVVLHAATAMLLFLALCRLTGRVWPSALVAALFAIHPLRAESVVWVTERKDVLSGLCFMLTLAAYEDYVRHRPSLVRYLAVMALFSLGLLSKAMLVTLPLVLLLLDYWPLGRFAARPCRGAPPQKTPSHGDEARTPGGENFMEAVLGRFPLPWQLLIEKLPLLLLVAIVGVVTVSVQGQALGANDFIPWQWRINNALISYVRYLGQLFFPVGLAVLYPPGVLHFPLWKVLGSVLILLGVTAAALVWRRKYPYLLVGWLWYLGMLLPVIGLLHVGITAQADRFTYLTEIGPCIALVWAAADACRSWSVRGWACGMASALMLAVLMGCAWRQTSFWHDSETLWNHTLACTSGNCVAHNSLGVFLVGQGRLDEAKTHYQASLEIDPQDVDPRLNLASVLAAEGRFEEAVACYQKALQIQPDFAKGHCDLGDLLAHLGRLDEALDQYRKASELQPDDPLAHRNLGDLLGRLGRFDEALAHFQKALEITPDDPDTHNNFGLTLQAQGNMKAAMAQFERALEIQPNNAEAHYNVGVVLGGQGRFHEAMNHCRQALKIKPDKIAFQRRLAWMLATCPEASLRGGAEAIELAQRVSQFYGGERLDALDTLAAAYAEGGRFPEALAAARKALDIARQHNDRASLDALQARIALYQRGRPFRQAPSAATTAPPKP
jgi:tetratricopeptide (TPR) repeat protein